MPKMFTVTVNLYSLSGGVCEESGTLSPAENITEVWDGNFTGIQELNQIYEKYTFRKRL